MIVYVRVRDPQQLRACLLASDTTQAAIAAQAGISPQSISQLASGARRTTPVERAAALEDALGVRRGTLFIGTDDPELARPYFAGAVA